MEFNAPEFTPPEPTTLKLPPAVFDVQNPDCTLPATTPLRGTGVLMQKGPYDPGVTKAGF